MSEVGAVYQVAITRAGGWLVGDHDVDAETLYVDAAWDFDVDGGTLTIDEEPYEYTSVTFTVDPDTGEPVDDEPAVVELSTGLVADQLDGDLVLTFPHSETKTALVEAKGFGEAVSVRVPHDLYDKLPEGVWGSAADAPTVTIVPDGDGWVVEDVLGREPVVDGGFIDPDTLPVQPPAEPVAPSSSPATVLEPQGLGALVASWTPVTNETPVMYDVYAGTSSPVDDGDALLGSTAGSLWSFSALSGSPLADGQNYFVAVRARSDDQYGPMGSTSSAAQIVVVDLSGLDDLQDDIDELNDTTIPGLESDIADNASAVDALNDTTLPALQDELDDILPITETKISDDAVSADKLRANSVVAGKIAADAVTANTIDAGAVTTNKLAADAVTADKIGANEVTAGKIAADAVTANELAADSVTAEQLTAGSVGADAIAANAVNAEHISANSIDGEKLTGTVILGSDITTAETGERHGLSANEGHYSYGPDGQLVFSAKGGNASFTGDVTAVSLNVTGGATWAGSNVGASNASTMMASGISAPGSPPNVEWGYDEITLDSGAVAGDRQQYRYGLVWHNDHWWVASRLDDDTLVLVEFDSGGTFVDTHAHSSPPVGGLNSLAMLGGKFYSFVSYSANLDVLVWNGDGTPAGSFDLTQPPGSDGIAFLDGSLGSDGTNLLFAWKEDDGMRWQKYNTSGNRVGGVVNTGENVTPNAVLGGNFFIPGLTAVVVVAGPNMAQMYDPSGGNLSNAYDFPSENTRGMAWRTDPVFEVDYYFAGLHSPRKIRIHTSELEGEGRLPNLYVAALWRREPGPVYKTEASRRGLRGFAQRAKHTFSLPVPCPGTGLASDPNAVEFYAGRSKGRTKLEWAAKETGLSPGDLATTQVTDWVLPDGTDDAFAPPPATNSFPMADAYDHYSQAVIPGTTDPQTLLNGDGETVLYGLKTPFASYYRATTTNIPDASNTQVAIAAELETHPCVSYASGGNFTINWPGLYRVEAHFTFHAGSGYRTGSILKDGNDVVDDIQFAGGGSGSYTSVSPRKTIRLDAGDVITVTLYQNSGGALQIFEGEDRAFITFERVGI